MAKEFSETPEKDLDRILREKFTTPSRSGYISVNGVCLPESYIRYANILENFKVRDDDTWVCSFPRTGTTWTMEMVWCIANNLDFDGAKVQLTDRFPFFEISALVNSEAGLADWPDIEIPEWLNDSLLFVEKMPSPRFIKSHLPFDLLPREIRDGTRKPKIVYVTRNPKDTCISHFHHSQLLEGYRGNFQDFCELFLGGKLCYAPYWNHVLGYWSRRNNENILFLKYEDMKTDHASVIRKTADFLGKSLNDGSTSNTDTIDTNVEKLVKHLSFENMKSNPAVNAEDFTEMLKKIRLTESEATFIRKGEIGQWKTEMSKEMCDRFDKLTREAFENCDLVL